MPRTVPSADKTSAVNSFYHLAQIDLRARPCRGLACFAARGAAPQQWQQALASDPPVYCYGQCFSGPASGAEYSRPAIAAVARHTVLLSNLLAGGVRDIQQYQERGGGRALMQTLTINAPQKIIAEISASGLRGRGGAGFPTGRKWQLVKDAVAPQKYVIANADEGDPGAFSDRLLLEDDPFMLIEALIIAGLTVGASRGFIYLRKEYQRAALILRSALQQAYASGWLGNNIFGSPQR
ncbi:MAG TPA: hypothetical protein VLC91_06480, partial [Spongiibacteraceae bacterium]|nr:hypothetical protein [Spongiibacteraceae bacterium]